jgi:hypothetical protein
MATSSISIFRNEARPSGQGGPRSCEPTIAIRPPSAPRPDTIDARLIAILDAPLGLGETAAGGYARKEQELGGVLATLSVLDSRALHLRLTTMQSGDELANKFARLTIERRTRLLNFLSDVRRRHALAAAGR